MTSFDASMDRDANRVPLTGDFPFRTKRTLTFNGAVADDWGNDGGALDGGAVYTVTGLVKVQLYGECTTDLVGGATVEVGITAGTAIFCSQITDTVLDAGEIYIHDTTPATSFIVGEEQAAVDNLPIYLLNGTNIILTTTTTDTDSGVIDFFALWKPISDDGSVVATTT